MRIEMNANRRIVLVTVVVMVGIVASSLAVLRSRTSHRSAVRGELVETFCWGTQQIGGAEHAKCGIDCAKRGIPLAVYDAEARQAFVLLPGRDKASLPPELVAAMGRKIAVHGDVIRRGDSSFVTVQSWELQ
jgi:hypothetical protein